MIKDLLTKVPFTRISPNWHMQGRTTANPYSAALPNDRTEWLTVSQSDFLRELEPSGHKINSPLFYPNIVKYDEEKKRFFEQKVFRASFPFQWVITVQQLVHLCGNDIRHELTDAKTDSAKDGLFLEFQKGWLEKNMEIAFYEFAKSVKATGDGAVAMFLHNGKVGYKNLSYLNGDTLYPHYDPVTGELETFVRKYCDYDEEGDAVVSWVEVWDRKMLYRYKQGLSGFRNKAANRLKEAFGIEGYRLAHEPQEHGFDEVPVVYHRDRHGPCWTFSQDSIDKYELAVSQLCQNNMAYAFPIMLLKGDDVEIQGDMYGAVKAITMGKDDDASFMSRPDASPAFELQLKILLDNIFQGSFIVKPPEIKSGDLPGVAIKLIYSPSLERAMIDSREFDRDIDKLSRLFKYGYGIELKKTSLFGNMKIFSWIEPYIHQNTAEMINNLVQTVSVGILSRQTATDLTGLGRNQEWDRLIREKKEEQAADRLEEIRLERKGNGQRRDGKSEEVPEEKA